MTRFAQVCFTGTEADQAEQHDHGTIDEVLGDPDMERGGDAPEEAVPLPCHPESRPYTFNHEVGVDVFEVVDSVGLRFPILNAFSMGTTNDQAWIVRESEVHGGPSSHACLRAFVHGWTRWLVDLDLFAAIEGHTMEACWVRLLPRTVWRSDLQDWKRRNNLEEWNGEAPWSRR